MEVEVEVIDNADALLFGCAGKIWIVMSRQFCCMKGQG
jgi:hypothetical protein